jgi:hypothetical protein
MPKDFRCYRTAARATLQHALMLLVIALAAPAGAQHQHDHDHEHDHAGAEHQEKGKHIHGRVTLNIAIEGDLLSAEIDTPAIHVLGFENVPNSDEQRSAVAAANTWLESGRSILAVARSAGCRLDRVDYTPPKLGRGHADYRARFQYRCAQPSTLQWVDFRALDKLQGVERVEVNLITASSQQQLLLKGNEQRIALK